MFFLAAIFPDQVEKFLLRVINAVLPSKWRAPAANIIQRFVSGLGSLRSPRQALLVVLTSLAVWLLETLTYWFVMRPFHSALAFSR